MHVLILIAGLASSPAPATAEQPQRQIITLEAPSAASQFSALTRDTRGRPTIEAEINGKGPFRMVVDTAAQTSLVTPALVEELSLPPIGDMDVGGVAGHQQAGLYGVDRFKTALFDIADVGLLALPNPTVTEARGIVGMEMFTQDRLVFDNTAERLTVEASGSPAEGFVAVAGRLGDNGLLETAVEIDGVMFNALIDTGASVSVASDGALSALSWATTDPRLSPAGAIRGATQHGTSVLKGTVGRIRLGPVTFKDVPLIFVADPPSDAGTGDAPTLILGSDLLNNLDAFALDFPKAEFQVRVPR